jgi:hypothetical protein
MSFVDNEYAVGYLAAGGEHEPFPRRRSPAGFAGDHAHGHAGISQYGVESGGERIRPMPHDQAAMPGEQRRRRDSHQSSNTADNRAACHGSIDRVERPILISQEVLRPVISKIT